MLRHVRADSGAVGRRVTVARQAYLLRGPGLIAGMTWLLGLAAVIDAALPAQERRRAQEITHL
jgi:hypothetical protein